MTCSLCGNKPSWCECTPADYAARDMADELEDIKAALEGRPGDAYRERRFQLFCAMVGCDDWDGRVDAVWHVADRILAAEPPMPEV